MKLNKIERQNTPKTNKVLSRVISPYIFIYDATMTSVFSINERFGLIAMFSFIIYTAIKIITL